MKTKPTTYNYQVQDICFDCGCDETGANFIESLDIYFIDNVPQEIAESPIELEEYLANELSEATGFCVENFNFKRIK